MGQNQHKRKTIGIVIMAIGFLFLAAAVFHMAMQSTTDWATMGAWSLGGLLVISGIAYGSGESLFIKKEETK